MGAPASLMEREALPDIEPPRVSHSSPGQGVAVVIRPFDVIGDELLDGLDRLGQEGISRWQAYRSRRAALVVNRVPPLVSLLGLLLAMLVGLASWAAYGNMRGENAWMTDPGAGNAAIAAEMGATPATTVPATAAATGTATSLPTPSQAGATSAGGR